ncbi:hypothetical protein C8R44DRAFT_751230 [Mycena epipterygia]|nr:hypothetical protein C8R44DRAFT_751230 [Mycena epipterygia]
MFPPIIGAILPPNGRHKVHTDLAEVSPPRPKKWKTGGDERDDLATGHRGRGKVQALQAGLRKELLDCKSNKEFWDFVRKRTDLRPKKSKVSLQDLSDDFEARLNYPRADSPGSTSGTHGYLATSVLHSGHYHGGD